MKDNNPTPESKAYPVGELVANRYEVLSYIGHGGMGYVLKAKDLILDNDIVVLKILFPKLGSDPTNFARFRREVLLTRKLAHPNIVKIYDFGEADKNTYFISMEYIEGENLRQKLDHCSPNGLPFDDVVNYLYQIASGLQFAHSQGIVHRDIKPANILLGPNSEIKITDFGVARSIESNEKLTATDEAIGSPLYMAPEQLDSTATTNRSDIYAFGIMAYELVMGKPPFYSENWVALVKMHMHQAMPDFASKEKGIPLWFQDLVHKATAKDPDKRFQSAQEICNFITRMTKGKHLSIDKNSGNDFEYRETSQTAFAMSILLISFCVFLVLGIGGYYFFDFLG